MSTIKSGDSNAQFFVDQNRLATDGVVDASSSRNDDFPVAVTVTDRDGKAHPIFVASAEVKRHIESLATRSSVVVYKDQEIANSIDNLWGMFGDDYRDTIPAGQKEYGNPYSST